MPENLAREIVKAVKPVLKPICALGDGLWTPGGNTMTWNMEQWAEGIIAAKLAEANTARDERDVEVREAFDAAFILNSEGDPMYVTAGVSQAIPARIRQKVRAALALLGGGE